jgi:transcriptional regulator of nitric oxide reductase
VSVVASAEGSLLGHVPHSYLHQLGELGRAVTGRCRAAVIVDDGVDAISGLEVAVTLEPHPVLVHEGELARGDLVHHDAEAADVASVR